MLAQVFPIEHKYHIYEDSGEDQRQLVISASCTPVGDTTK